MAGRTGKLMKEKKGVLGALRARARARARAMITQYLIFENKTA